ncbi:PD-(D/E)XK nuclease family protein [Demequina sp. SYSU T00068]|uniref:PD-(D/E)XK nuclease family protein n=1 Tax=Demequina lignilytica TaxID=3051663 RepID=UPI00262CF9C4|nr:PD-(D/E)XK nuclease family protein [Demequina sp. SYSU T00068]MDN4489256.1 PD-(D/E)XK nuclease family protein [Demequina sp. SYSU T00068]
MRPDLVSYLLPVLGRSTDVGFNVFDVMHHGQHEKQISNVFRWLLDADGTHSLGGSVVRIFVDAVNNSRHDEDPLPTGGYWVRQEVNMSLPGEGADVADLVLESDDAVIVIENYATSDGHGHGYHNYRAYSTRDGKTGAVVLLCHDEDRALQTRGWENAAVVTYAAVLGPLKLGLDADRQYQRKNPEAYWFVQQMHRKFAKGKGVMEEGGTLDFVVAMCETGEAGRYQGRAQVAAEQFANDLAEQAVERFGEGRELLQRVKDRLKAYAAGPLAMQLKETFGEESVKPPKANLQGIFQWTIRIRVGEDVSAEGASVVLKFGPSAWFAVERDDYWSVASSADIDYSRVFVGGGLPLEIGPSSVALSEVLDGLEPDDTRLHDAILARLGPPTASTRA